jgi:LysM repeat protein
LPTATPLTYTVVRGDTLTKIAKKFGVTVEQILAANPQIKDANTINVGDVIVIPTGAAAASPTP